MPNGSVPQYDNSRPTFPKNNINSHVAGNVATMKTINAPIRTFITPTPLYPNSVA